MRNNDTDVSGVIKKLDYSTIKSTILFHSLRKINASTWGK
jgi:hypothetical protein